MDPEITLDRSRSFGTIIPPLANGAKYEQDGLQFDSAGIAIDPPKKRGPKPKPKEQDLAPIAEPVDSTEMPTPDLLDNASNAAAPQ